MVRSTESDITMDDSGTITAKHPVNELRYSYDAWGACTISGDTSGCSIAAINPFRYRGYYFDAEIGIYYLKSRYYIPNIGRFLNSDSVEWIGTDSQIVETNIFAYCKNDCVNKADETGYGGVEALLAALSTCIDVISKIVEGYKR